MSAKATFWAWRQDVKSTAKLTLLALANCHNESNDRCDPSVTYLSKSTGLNRKTVMNSIQNLEDCGLILPQRSIGQSTEYRLNFNAATSAENGTTTSTKNNTTGSNLTSTKTGSTENGTSTKNGQSQKRDTTSTKNGHDQYQKRDTNLKESKKNLKVYRKIDVGDVPESLRGSAKEFIDHRVNLKKPLTQNSFNRFLMAVGQTARELNLDQEFVITECIDAGWQSVKPHWLQNRLAKKGGQHEQFKTANERAADRAASTYDYERATSFAKRPTL